MPIDKSNKLEISLQYFEPYDFVFEQYYEPYNWTIMITQLHMGQS